MASTQALPDYAFAVIATLLWAISAQVITSGLAAIPAGAKLRPISLGLLISLGSGSLALFLLGGAVLPQGGSLWIILAGILTFPLGTGLYYLCGHAFGGRMDFASQFSNIKPFLSVAFAFLILGEPLAGRSVLALVLSLSGIAFLLWGTVRGTFSWTALGLGFALALAWSGGEAFAKLGLSVGEGPSLHATLLALISGTLVGAVVILPWLAARPFPLAGIERWGRAFALHGVLSFAVAYACLFESIQRIGLGQTVLIIAVWPALAVLLALLRNRLRGERCTLPRAMVLAVILLLAGSLAQISDVLNG